MSVENQLIISVSAIYLGVFFAAFFNALIRDILFPLLTPIISVDGISKYVVQIGGVKLNIGDVLSHFVNLITAILIVQYLIPHIKEYVPIVGRR